MRAVSYGAVRSRSRRAVDRARAIAEPEARQDGREAVKIQVGLDRAGVLALQIERVRHARAHGWIVTARVLVGCHRRVEQAAVAARRDERRQQVRIVAPCARTGEQPHHGLGGAPQLHFEVRVQVVSHREVGVERQRALERALRPHEVRLGIRAAVFRQHPQDTPEPRPRRRVARDRAAPPARTARAPPAIGRSRSSAGSRAGRARTPRHWPAHRCGGRAGPGSSAGRAATRRWHA